MDMSNLQDVINQIQNIISFELFNIGNRAISLRSIFIAIVIVGIAWLISKYTRNLFDRKFSDRFRKGTDHTLKRLLNYTIMTIGVLVAVDFIGIDLTSLAVVASFLSVGIGFGLRNIASNFISGVILMLERPISVDDMVTVDDYLGRIRDIGLRATLVRTVDNQEIVIPNSTFVEQNVINWTRGDRKIRLRFPVGVAYGSDIDLVKNTLLEAAHEVEGVLDDPEPSLVFDEFGGSSLNFELRVWVKGPETRISVRDELNTKINDIFERKEIEMPFPQRDLHLRSSVPVSLGNDSSTPESTDGTE